MQFCVSAQHRHYSKPSLCSTINCGSPISSLCDGSLKISSKSMVSSLTLKISSDRFELGRNGRHWTCCTALNSICNFRAANNPQMFLRVEKFTLYWLCWKFFPNNSRGWLVNLINVTSWGYMFINCY